jgi:hypothetical protein
MKTNSLLLSLTVAGTFLAVPSFAQSSTPVMEPPPPTAGAAPAPSAKPSTGLSITEATNSTGKSSGNNSVKELRFSAVDADSDGRISLSEFVTFMDAGNVHRSTSQAGISPVEELFHHIDRNNDNALSEAEVTAYQDEQDRAKE